MNAKEQAFVNAIGEHKGIIFKVCRMYCPAGEDCDDLYQDIVVQLWRAWESFRGEAKLSTWIYRVALNTAISGLRRDKRKPENHQLSPDLLQLPQEDAQRKKEEIEMLHMAIARLSDVEKAMVMLYLEEQSYEDIAHIMGITQNNVRVKMLRIREKLRKIMDNH